jgi:polysaccharide pyruvyl transferase WcaK-like protein
MTAEEGSPSFIDDVLKSDQLASGSSRHSDEVFCERGPRIALLTPYSGSNLGDAAIQDAMIANIRARLPSAQFSGISLDCGNFAERHGTEAFPLCGTNRPFYGMPPGAETNQREERAHYAGRSREKGLNATRIKKALKRVPVVGQCLKKARASAAAFLREIRHSLGGYRFLRTQDLLVVSGGGQLDEEWGGPWGHPFTLFKWAVLARVADIPFAIASAGACKVTSTTSRFFMSAALRLARYRSYRDKNSREIAAGLLSRATRDSVVPDLAFSLPSSELPAPAGVRSISQGRTIVAISPMAYAKPGSWPYEDRALYDRYVQQMSHVVSQLLERGFFLVIVWSSLSDESVIPELLGRLDSKSQKRLARQMHIPTIAHWQNLVALLQDVDFLIASRLHSAILGFLTQRPTVAISFDPKVDWVMEDLCQTDYLLQIRDFTAENVIQALDRLALRRNCVMEQIGSYRDRALSVSALQYDTLGEFARVGRRRGN